MAEDTKSKTVRAGAKTYFFDLKKTGEGANFLVITESRFKGEEEERERSSIAVFPEHVEEFIEALQEMAKNLS